MKRLIASLVIFGIIVLSITQYYRMPYVKTIKDDATIMVYYVGHKPIYGAEYLIITKLKSNDELIVELILGPGPEQVVRIEGREAQSYLDRVHLK